MFYPQTGRPRDLLLCKLLFIRPKLAIKDCYRHRGILIDFTGCWYLSRFQNQKCRLPKTGRNQFASSLNQQESGFLLPHHKMGGEQYFTFLILLARGSFNLSQTSPHYRHRRPHPTPSPPFMQTGG